LYKPSTLLTPVLYIPGMIYQAGVYLRNRAFDAGFLHARNLPRPVVSVGNLTLGGTGKTPFVVCLADILKETGCKTAVLTRGYGRGEPGKTIILHPEEASDFSTSRLGDEPALIRRRLPESWLGVSADRFLAANAISRRIESAKHGKPLVFILDDGFQCRGIRRDLDIVIIDPAQPPGAERLFPMGALREPAAELRRARVIVINGYGLSGTDGTGNAGFDTIKENLRKYAPEADYFQCVQRIHALIPFSAWLDFTGTHQFSEQPKTAFLAAAIGNPYRFRDDMQGIGIEMRGCAFFSDHAVIDKKRMEMCIAAARKANAEAIIITEKDAVKIFPPPDFPLLVAVQKTELHDAGRFLEILQRCVNKT